MNKAAARIGDVSSVSIEGSELTFDIRDGAKVGLHVLATDLVRVRVAPSGHFEANVSQAVIETDWPAVAIEVSDGDGVVVISTSAMKLAVGKTPFVLECRDADGKLMVTDDPGRRIEWTDGRTEVFKKTQRGEKYVGLGWRPHRMVRNGTTFLMRNKPTYDEPETFYSGVPLWYGLRDGNAYAIFFDDTSWGTIDVGKTSKRRMSFRNLGGQVDYYYFAGPTMGGILDRYTQLTGRPYMPPRWSIGYQQSRWSYTPASQLLEIADGLRRRKIPCDVIYLDIDYMPGGHALTFDPAKFPDPPGMLIRLHDQGFRAVANVSPLLLRDDPRFAEAERDSCFLRIVSPTSKGGGPPQKKGDPPQRRGGPPSKKRDATPFLGRHFYWDEFGGGTTGDAAWLDFSRTRTCEWWARQHAAFLNTGIDGLWNDLNEPDELGGEWPADLKYDFDGKPVDHCKSSTQYPLLQTRLSYSILRRHDPDRRPFVISRGGYAGIQRYATLWTGDNTGDWTRDFKRNIPMGLSMSISGNPHNGHDIGGYFGHPTHDDLPSGELYARWMQAGVFSPFCRQHRDGFGNVADPPRPLAEPWRFGEEVEHICRDFINLRYRLMPYLYTLFYNAHVSGDPVQRPTLYDFPNDPATLKQDYDFMFGPAMLVSPVTEPGVETWDTYLPAGTAWIDFWDDTLHAGGQTVTTSAPLSRLPIFVRDGAIIPTGPVVQYEGERPLDVLTLKLYPTGAASSFVLYEDDGISWGYAGGVFCKTHYVMTGLGRRFQFVIAGRQGRYQPAPRQYHLEIHRWPGLQGTPTLDGEPLGPCDDPASVERTERGFYLQPDTGILHVRFPDTGKDIVFGIT